MNASLTLRRILFLLAGLFVFGLMLITWPLRGRVLIVVETKPATIMGTSTAIKAVVSHFEKEKGKRALRNAEEALRLVDSRMSIWVGSTELAQLNKAPAGQVMRLSPETLILLNQAKKMTEETGGAFDPTCTPLIELWKKAEQDDREPTSDELAQAIDKTGWRWFVFHKTGMEKKLDQASIDLGGIAKGYAVERAAEAMQKAPGLFGGMVQCGGDTRVFGVTAGRQTWRVGIRNPFAVSSEDTILEDLTINLKDCAVSTSGNYERYYTVQGKRRSHIIDPRTGIPVDEVPQVTVIAPNATLSDGWSTALSVLGPEGLMRLPQGVEAMMIVGNKDGKRVYKTEGFEKYIESK